MEVFPCSGVPYAGESDCSQPNPGITYVYKGEPNWPENGEQVNLEDDQLNDSLLKMEGPKVERQGQMQQQIACELFTNSDCQYNGASCCDNLVEDQKESCSLHDAEDDEINEPCLTSENSLSIVDVIESESPNNNREGELSFPDPTWLEEDKSVALWVKVYALSKFSFLLYVGGFF